MPSRKILVTGTAGFIGYHLAKKLLECGDEVVGIDNINDYTHKFYKMDLSDKEVMEQLFQTERIAA